MTQRSLRELPKAHLHAHVDGSYPLEAVRRLAVRRGHDVARPDGFAGVEAFFAAYGTVPELVETHDDLADLCRALVEQEAADGVIYLEPAIEPQLHGRLGSLDQVTRTMLAAFAEAAADTVIEVGALLTINTDCDEPISRELATVAARHAGAGVTGLGTAGFVEPAGLARFADAAALAGSAGLGVVSHAGQTGGPDSVREALDELGAVRLSHGFRSAEDPQLVERLVAEQIGCDVCPVSNVALGVVADLASHPARALIAAGVPVTLNADDQLWFGHGATAQYEIARRVWGLDDAALAGCARSGGLARGMSTQTRHRLDTAITAWLDGGNA